MLHKFNAMKMMVFIMDHKFKKDYIINISSYPLVKYELLLHYEKQIYQTQFQAIQKNAWKDVLWL